MELTILMPCLNEAETIADCITKAKNFLQQENILGEILIADNGSSDNSKEIATSLGARVVEIKDRGYGAALLGGINHAAGQYVIMGDADSSYDFSNLKPFLNKLREGHELVMGNRFQGGIKPGAMPFLNKYLGNPVLSFLGRLFFNIPIGDFHCGLRAFNRAAIQSLQLQTKGMEFASEMVVKSALKSLKIAEVPTILFPDGRSRPPHLRKWRDGWRHLRFLLLSSPRWLFFYPGLLLIFLGSITMAFLSITRLKVGHVFFDIHTLLFASAFLIIGMQSVFFSLCSNILRNLQLGLPGNKKIALLLQNFTVEKGIIAGLLSLLAGTLGLFWSFHSWMQAHFGVLIPTQTMRIAIPAVTFLIIGLQIIFAAFFMDLLLDCQENIKKGAER